MFLAASAACRSLAAFTLRSLRCSLLTLMSLNLFEFLNLRFKIYVPESREGGGGGAIAPFETPLDAPLKIK